MAEFRGKSSAWRKVQGMAIRGKRPVAAMLEIADRCNEVCVHCYQVQGQKGEMTTAQLKGVLEELASMGVMFLTLSGGEPTLRKDFLELVGHARRLRFAVKIYTNGLLVSDGMARRLSELAVQEVQVSLYSHEASVHDRVTGVPRSFERTVAGVRALLSHGVHTVVKSPYMTPNEGQHLEYVRFVEGLGADFMFDSVIMPREDGSVAPLELTATRDSIARLNTDLHPASREGENSKELHHSPCGACSTNVHIEANGELRPCTQLTIPVGHVGDGLQSAWDENPVALAIRGLTWRDHWGCRDCDLRRYCHRCYASALAEVGDALGPYPSACSAAQLRYEQKEGTVEWSGDAAAKTGPFRVRGNRVVAWRAVPAEADNELAARYPFLRKAFTTAHTFDSGTKKNDRVRRLPVVPT